MTIVDTPRDGTVEPAPAAQSVEGYLPEVTTDTTPLFDRAMDGLWALKVAKEYTERISNDEQGVLAAMALCLRADCTRRRVACVVTDEHGRVIGAGRNGAPPGRPGCLSAGACPRGRLDYTQVGPGTTYSTGTAGACIANHAEANGIAFSDPVARRGGTIYITDPPCDDCSRYLAGSGLARAVWPEMAADGGWVIKSIVIAEAPVGGYLR